MRFHLETVDVRILTMKNNSLSNLFLFQQLRTECMELRRSEKNLRSQVDSLTDLIHTRNREVCLMREREREVFLTENFNEIVANSIQFITVVI